MFTEVKKKVLMENFQSWDYTPVGNKVKTNVHLYTVKRDVSKPQQEWKWMFPGENGVYWRKTLKENVPLIWKKIPLIY